MEYKVSAGFFTRKTPAAGEAEIIWTVYGNLDLGQDIGHPGMFDFAADGPEKVKFLNQHNMDSVLSILGKVLSMRDVSRSQLPAELRNRYPEATGGAWARVKYLLDTPEGAGAFARAAVGAAEFSYGYDALQSDFSNVKGQDGKTVTARNLRKVKLYEISQCIIGMNPATGVISTKSARPDSSPDWATLAGERLVLEKRLEDIKEREIYGGMTKIEFELYWEDVMRQVAVFERGLNR